MRMRKLAMVCVLAVGSAVAWAQGSPEGMSQAGGGAQAGQGPRGGRGFGGGMGMGQDQGQGAMGTVTEVAPDHFTIKNELGETWTIHYSVNTRLMKMPARAPGSARPAEGVSPESIKASDIKAGDMIAAAGEVDTAAKSVGAVFVMLMDPERARQMREMQANFGKTWLMGKVTAISDATVTLHSTMDNADHTFTADENTTFRKRREPITLGDVQVGDTMRVEGAVQDGKFVATTVMVMMPPMQGGPARRQGDTPR